MSDGNVRSRLHPMADASPELREWLVRTLAARAGAQPDEIHDDTPLAEDGLCLDSLALMDLIGEIEKRLGIGVDEGEVSPENFGTLRRLLWFLRVRTAPR